AGELAVCAPPHDRFIGTELEHAAIDDVRLVADLERFGADPSQRHVGRRSGAALVQIDKHIELGRRDWPVVDAQQARRLLNHLHFGARKTARHLRIGAGAHYDGAVRCTGVRHRRPESLADRQHRHEHDDDSGDADHGNGRGACALRDGSYAQRRDGQRLRQPAPNHVRRSASVMRSRIAVMAGKAPATTPSAQHNAMPMAMSRLRMMNTGRSALLKLPPSTAKQVIARPRPPPSSAIRIDSTSTRPSTRPLEKPSVLSTASSLVRSRTDCAIVFASTSRNSVKRTAARIEMMIALMFPTWLTNPCRNAFSVEVFVSADELANCASRRAATSAAWDGSSIRRTYQPTCP